MESLRRRLDELRRSERDGAPAPPGPVARALDQVVGGCESRCGPIRHWRLAVPFREVCDAPVFSSNPFEKHLECEIHRGQFAVLDPARALVIDIETGGFSGTPVFLIGVVALDRRPLHVEQWLARDYPEEEAILRRLGRWARRRSTWVTFNGKAFDVPFVLERATLYRVELPAPRIHVDLLPAARRRWHGRLPDFRLSTIERQILGRARPGDVPGSDVPDLFHHYIRTRNAAPLKPVLQHNQLDLVSSTELLLRLAREGDTG